jgi:dihydrofolate reductase
MTPSGSATITIVAAVAENGVIGRDGGIPWRLPGDLGRVKRLTMGHVLVMGRRTYESIGRPLPGRTTIVVTRQPQWRADGVLVAHDLETAFELAARQDGQTYVFGGSDVYAGALARTDRMVITWVEAAPEGDTTFPDVDWTQWDEIGREAGEGFTVVEYERRRH